MYKENHLYLIIAGIAVLLVLVLLVLVIKNLKSNDKSGEYISLNMPLSSDLLLENNYIEKTIYTFVYDSNRIVRRIIFTDVYYLNDTAASDYNTYLNNNNYDNDWNMPKRILKIKNNELTYEYNSDITEEYYSDFIGTKIDDIIDEYGEDKVLDNFVPNLTKKELLYLPDEPSNNEDKDNASSNVNFELMATQAEKKLGETFTTNYTEAFNVNYQYYATVDKESIKYTNEYSNGDYYYIMVGTVKNSSTNIAVGKYLIRCKWDKSTNEIVDYGDNSKIMIMLNIYEKAISKVTDGVGTFYIDKNQYKNEILWDTTKLDKTDFNTIFNEVDKVNYYCEYSDKKDEEYFNQMKQNQNDIIKKLLNSKEITIYVVQIVTNNELESATSLTKYINSNLYIADDTNFNNLIDYSKNLGLFYEETLNLNN